MWMEAPIYDGSFQPFYFSEYETKEDIKPEQYPIPNPMHPYRFDESEFGDEEPRFYFSVIEPHKLILSTEHFLAPPVWSFSYTIGTDKELAQELKEAERHLEGCKEFWEPGEIERQELTISFRKAMLAGEIFEYESKRAKYWDIDMPFYKVIRVKPQGKWSFKQEDQWEVRIS